MTSLPPLTPQALRDDVRAMYEDTVQMLEATRQAFLQPSPATNERIARIAADLHKREKHVTDHVASQLRSRPWSLGPAEHLAFLPAALERVGDSIETLARCQQGLHREGLAYSEEATREILGLFTRSAALLRGIQAALGTGDRAGLADVRRAGDDFQGLTDSITRSHQARIIHGECLPRVSSVFLSMLDAFREIGRYAGRMSEDVEKSLG
jgi:phosphate:Na+ symporter